MVENERAGWDSNPSLRITVNQAGLNSGTRGTLPLMLAREGGHLPLFIRLSDGLGNVANRSVSLGGDDDHIGRDLVDRLCGLYVHF